MAFYSVVSDSFVDSNVIPAVEALDADEQIGPLAFAMLVPSRVSRGYRSLVLSSEKLDRLGPREGTLLVYRALDRNKLLNDQTIDTISVLRTTSFEIGTLSEAFQVPDPGTAYQVGGLEIDALDLEQPVFLLSRPLPKAA